MIILMARSMRDGDLYEKEFIPQKLKLEMCYVDHKSFGMIIY